MCPYESLSLSVREDKELFLSESQVVCQLSNESVEDFFVSIEPFLGNELFEPT